MPHGVVPHISALRQSPNLCRLPKVVPDMILDSLFSSAASATLEKLRSYPGSEPLVVVNRCRPGTRASIIAAAAPPAMECALG